MLIFLTPDFAGTACTSDLRLHRISCGGLGPHDYLVERAVPPRLWEEWLQVNWCVDMSRTWSHFRISAEARRTLLGLSCKSSKHFVPS